MTTGVERTGGPEGMAVGVHPTTHRRMLLCVAALTALVLVLTAGIQIYDANLYVMAEATALLAGDRPGVDFFWWGTPLESYLAAAAQLAAGHRLIGEFARQWLFIIAGVVVAFHLGLRLSGSTRATAAVLVPTLMVLANTPTYHASKLFFFPLFMWMAWKYLDQPSAGRASILGAATAVAFLSRHDYGIYLGLGSGLALTLARLGISSPRGVRPFMSDGLACAMAATAVLAPFALSVHRTEGLVEYARARLALYDRARSPYTALLSVNPLRLLVPEPLPPATPGHVWFVWRPDIDDFGRQELQQRYRLRPVEGRDGRDRLGFEVPNIYDPSLLELEPFIRDPFGFPWDRLKEARSWLPPPASAAVWLRQVALIIPIVLVTAGAWHSWRGSRKLSGGAVDGARMVVAGAFLALVDEALFREPSYVVVSAPLTAALGARFLVTRAIAVRTVAMAVLVLTTYAAFAWARVTPLVRVSELPGSLSRAVEQLFASPPVEGKPVYRYLYACTADGDRLLVTGATPGHVSYYAQRPIAGGHVGWHQGWRSDPVHETQSLELLERQSVPFAVSTHDPVLDDLKRYPRIREYVEKHYVVLPGALDGTYGTVLVDARRHPTSRFSPQGYPCFRD